jgi:hypothetical protein
MFAAVVLDPLAQIEDLLAAVASENRSTWPAAARSERVLELAHLADRVRAELLRAVGDWDAAGAWADDGAASGASWLGHRAGMGRGSGARLLQAARLVRTHDATADALARGDVTAAHVEVLASVVRHREDSYADDEALLLGAAEGLEPDDFTVVARRWRSLTDDRLACDEPDQLFERRYLHVSSSLFGAVHI